MVALRSLVAVLVTVLTLFGGAFRAHTLVRAHLAVQSATEDAKEATLDAGRTVVQGRATKPATPDPRDGRGGTGPAADVSRADARIVRDDARSIVAPEPILAAPHRRVRTHVEHMVFLI